MSSIGPLTFALLLVAVVAALWLLARLNAWLERRGTFSPHNELERLLVESVGTSEVTSEMCRMLVANNLLALEREEEPGVPMTFSASLPAELAGEAAMELDADGDVVEFGPWVVCFSSPQAVKQLSRDPVMGGLVTQVGTVREFAAKEVFQSALDLNVDVLLNPFVAVTRRFSREEIGAIFKFGEEM